MSENQELPKGWKQSTLGDVAKWGSGGTPKSGTTAFYGGTIPWAVISDLNEGTVTATAQSITELGLTKSSAKLVEAGTVLLAMYGSIGKTGIAGQQMATNQAIAFAVPEPSVIERRCLHLFLKSRRQQFLATGKGGTQANISQTIIKAWPIPLPPLAEQEKIVEILEEQLSRLDASLALVDSIEKSTSALRRSLLHSAFTGKLTETWREANNV